MSGLEKIIEKIKDDCTKECAVIEENAKVGESPEGIDNLENWGVTVIGEKVTIGKGASVKAKEMIDTDIEGVK